MRDLHRNRLLDAKLELGTEVQLFEFNLDKVIGFSLVLTALAGLSFLTGVMSPDNTLSFFIGAYLSLFVFYIIYGTN